MSKLQVLVVSEKSIITNMLLGELEKKNCEIVFTTDGLEAFNNLIKKKFDFVISSVQIDNLDGFQLLAAVRASHSTNSLTPFIMLTSVGNFDNFARLESRPDYILMKNESLVSELNSVLNKINPNREQKYKLLFIEDDKFTQTIIKTWFKKMDEIEFDIVESIAQLKDTQISPYDLIISDNNLQDGTVVDILKFLDNKPTIVYTASFSSVKIDTEDYPNLIGIKEKPYDTNYISKMLAKYA